MKAIRVIWARIDDLVAQSVEANEGAGPCDACGSVAGWTFGGSCPDCFMLAAREWEDREGMTSDALGLCSYRWPRLTRAALAELWPRQHAALAAADAHGLAASGR